jgi:hypothetical protein
VTQVLHDTPLCSSTILYDQNRSCDDWFIGRMESPELEEEEEEYRTTDIEDICEVTRPSSRQGTEVMASAAGRPRTSSIVRPLGSIITSAMVLKFCLCH